MKVTTDKNKPVAPGTPWASAFCVVAIATLSVSCSKKDGGGDEAPAEADPTTVVSGATQPAGQTSSGGGGGGGTVAPVNVPEPVIIKNAAPVPGNGGTLSASAVKADRASLNWTKATDAETKASDLKYIVYLSSADNIGTIDNAEANGTANGGYEYDVATRLISQLAPETTYYATVIVKDGEGKQAIYDTASFTTTAFPVPGGGGAITAVHNGADIDVSWTPGIPGLQYRLYYSDSDNVTTVVDLSLTFRTSRS